jgi:hypothetical protein
MRAFSLVHKVPFLFCAVDPFVYCEEKCKVISQIHTKCAFFHKHRGTLLVASLFRHCGTSRKVAGSIPDGVIGILHWHNPSGPGVDSTSNRN